MSVSDLIRAERVALLRRASDFTAGMIWFAMVVMACSGVMT